MFTFSMPLLPKGPFAGRRGHCNTLTPLHSSCLPSIVISLDWWSHRMRVRQDHNNMQKTCLEWKVASVVASMLVAATVHVLDDTVVHGTLHWEGALAEVPLCYFIAPVVIKNHSYLMTWYSGEELTYCWCGQSSGCGCKIFILFLIGHSPVQWDLKFFIVGAAVCGAIICPCVLYRSGERCWRLQSCN